MQAIDVEDVLERTTPYLHGDGQVQKMQFGGMKGN
jgi:hypothetical protein